VEPKPHRDRPRRARTFVVLGLLVIAAAGAGAYWLRHGDAPASTAARQPPPIPVTIATADSRDVPIYATGLGTVQASLTIAIHSQVDGKLQEVLFTEGQHVKKGDALAKIDPRLFQAALDQAKAKKAQDQAQLNGANKDLARFKELAAKSFETQQNLDLQQAKVDQFTAQISADEAAIETAQTQLDYTVIKAPSDGRMGVRQIDPGNVVHASDQSSLASLVLTVPSAVIFTLPARTLDPVRAAMARGPVDVAAYDQDNRTKLAEGMLLLIDNAIDQSTATIRLKAMFKNEDEKLWPGEFVNARLLLETRPQAVVIPDTAVQRGPDGLFTWVVSEQDTVAQRPIKTGDSSGGVTIVASGLKAGERIVSAGQYKLQANAKVSAAPAKAPAAAGTT
jgi:multidrug efflux system membrane fusion protein